MKKIARWSIITLAAVGSLLFLPSAVVGDGFSLGKSMEILVNVLRNISLYYVDEVDPNQLLKDATTGLVRNLDPYTEFISESEVEGFELMTTGKYGGIGSLIRQKGDWVLFAEPYKNSPADKAGIRIGDRLVEIDGRSAKGMTTEQVSNALKGEPGSKIKIKVQKWLTDEEVELRIDREIITIPGIPYYGMVSDSVGIICHNDFTENCSVEMRRAVEALKAQGAKALILDYRSNGGGLLSEAVSTLSLFVPRGSEVVSTRAKDSANNTTLRTQSDPIDTEIPIVVLVDGNSASAAEIVSGAIQDYDRGVLIGQRTYGKGLVQTSLPTGYDTFVKVTTAKYYLPSGRCIQAIDYASRDANGAIHAVPDSLINEFSTRAGRKVYDGGGVLPDVVLEPEYASSYAYVVYNMNLLSDFADLFWKRHQDSLTVIPREYRFTDADWEEFEAFMAEQEVPWESNTKRALELLRESAEQERYLESIEERIAVIEEQVSSKERTLNLHREELRDLIEKEMLLRFAYTEGAIDHSMRDDKTVARALDLLHNPKEYAKMLQPAE
ncbi:MAG: S41 family peptidase [Tidjanibacter sp.]|nr:S41 family peptidase [Tidjanibacter sp.]